MCKPLEEEKLPLMSNIQLYDTDAKLALEHIDLET